MNSDTVCVCGHSKKDHKSGEWIVGRYEPTGKCNHISYATTRDPIPCFCFNYRNAKTVKMLSKGTVIISVGRKAGKSAFYEMWREAHKNFLKAGKKFE